MVFMPSFSAQPNSRSISLGSKVSACHISSSFTASEGRKLEPTSHGCWLYHWLACSSVHFVSCPETERRNMQHRIRVSIALSNRRYDRIAILFKTPLFLFLR